MEDPTQTAASVLCGRHSSPTTLMKSHPRHQSTDTEGRAAHYGIVHPTVLCGLLSHLYSIPRWIFFYKSQQKTCPCSQTKYRNSYIQCTNTQNTKTTDCKGETRALITACTQVRCPVSRLWSIRQGRKWY